MNANIKKFITAAAIANYPNEACGFVLKSGKKSWAVEAQNTATEPTNYFLIAPKDYVSAMSKGEIIGVWHTHPEQPATPSDADRAGCENSNVTWYVMGVYKREGDRFECSEIESIEPNGFVKELLGRPYVYGVFDCWTIIRDYYKQEYNIDVPDFPRVDDFWEKGIDTFGENWGNAGFVHVGEGDLRVGDVLFMQTGASGLIDHAAIYVGNNQILHHVGNRLSRHDIYGGFWEKHTILFTRHKNHVGTH